MSVQCKQYLFIAINKFNANLFIAINIYIFAKKHCIMDILFDRHIEYLSDVPKEFTRGLMNAINWDSRLVMIRGPKGVGKSTLMQQYVLKNFGPTDRHILYCSADTAYFSSHTLIDTASEFVKKGGKVLLIDEIHKYENWSREIKEIYDLYKGLKVILSGSSLIQLNDGQADLSRRADVYDMPGLSFREYLWFRRSQWILPGGKKCMPPVGIFSRLS